jgi:hypothetical protein
MAKQKIANSGPQTEHPALAVTWPDVGEDAVLSAPIARLSAELAGEGAFSAPVKLPDSDQLTVRLVNISLLQKLDELRDDIALFQGGFFLAAGAILGLTPSMLAPSVEQGIWVAAASFCLFLGVFGFLWRRARKRADVIRAKLFAIETEA